MKVENLKSNCNKTISDVLLITPKFTWIIGGFLWKVGIKENLMMQ